MNKKEIAERKETSDIIEILDYMEDVISKAPSFPLTNRAIVEREDLLDYIAEIRQNYPAAMREAKWVKSERERILSEAQHRAEDIQKNAEKETLRLIDEHQITRQANEEADSIREAAEAYYDDTREKADNFAEDIFNNIENKLKKLLNIVQSEREEYISEINRTYGDTDSNK